MAKEFEILDSLVQSQKEFMETLDEYAEGAVGAHG